MSGKEIHRFIGLVLELLLSYCVKVFGVFNNSHSITFINGYWNELNNRLFDVEILWYTTIIGFVTKWSSLTPKMGYKSGLKQKVSERGVHCIVFQKRSDVIIIT